MFSSDIITREQVISLQKESKYMGRICNQALAGDKDSIKICEETIREMFAMEDAKEAEEERRCKAAWHAAYWLG